MTFTLTLISYNFCTLTFTTNTFYIRPSLFCGQRLLNPIFFLCFFGGQRLLKTRRVFLPTFLWAEMAKSQFFSFHAFDLPIGGPWTFLSRLPYIAFQDREFDGFHITYTIHSVFLDILKIQALDLQFASWAAGHRPPQNEGSWAFGAAMLPTCAAVKTNRKYMSRGPRSGNRTRHR